MAAEKDNVPLSDTEAAERPVREQLKKASIAGMPEDAKAAAASAELDNDTAEGAEKNGENNARPSGKRSSDEFERGQPEQTHATAERHHRRKRSRGNQDEEDELNNGQRKVSGEKPRDGEGLVNQTGEANGAPNPIPSDRAGTPDPNDERRVEDTSEAVASPKTKRSRLHSSLVEKGGTLAQEAVSVPAASASKGDSAASPEPGAQSRLTEKSAADNDRTKIPPTSGFANTSAVSPFNALSSSKPSSSELPQTSSSAFAASGFGSLSGSSTSGFGAIGKTSGGFGAGGGFSTGSKSPPIAETTNDSKPTEASSTTFGGALGQKSAFSAPPNTSSGFGPSSSGFGRLGAQPSGFSSGTNSGGFGSLASGGGLTSFASGRPSSALGSGSKSPKPFGAPVDDEEEAGNGADGAEGDDSGIKSPLSQEEDKQDERFYEQDLETGEEDESIEYSCRAKLYNYAEIANGKKEWRERGLGVLRLNVTKLADDSGGEEKQPKARFLMRADGSHRVLLNTPVKKEIKFGAPTGGPPQGGFMYFMGAIDGKTGLELLQLKMRQQFALELYEKVVELQDDM